MRVDIHIYVDLHGDIAWDAWREGEGPPFEPLIVRAGYESRGAARNAALAVAKLRGWEVANVYEAVEGDSN